MPAAPPGPHHARGVLDAFRGSCVSKGPRDAPNCGMSSTELCAQHVFGLLVPYGMLPIPALLLAPKPPSNHHGAHVGSEFPGPNPLACTRFPSQIPLQQPSSALAVLLSSGALLVLLLVTRAAGKIFK